jgi:ABC-type nitrate/sulfonate/bicarbonate transport system permease component
MKKRVEIARALVTEPELLILDEPFSALDIITRERLNILVKNLHTLQRSSAILVTHSVEEACFLSDRIYVMSDAPSRLVHVTEVSEKQSSRVDRFLLTEAEQRASAETRERATACWRQEEGPPTAGQPAAFPPRRARARRSAAPPSAVPRKRLAERVSGWAVFPIGILLILLALSVLKSATTIPDFVFPQPTRVLARFARTLGDGSILQDLSMTIVESLSGFAIALAATLLLGYAIARSRLLSRLLMPYLVAANTIPSVALAPFLVLWFGFGLAPRVVTSVIVIFFPMLINNVQAFRLAEEGTRELASFYRPGALLRFVKFELPSALPVVSSGIKVSITLSVIGAVVGEFVAGATGLGSLVTRAKAGFDVELMFVALLWLVILGLSYFGGAQLLFALLQRRRRKPVVPAIDAKGGRL